MVLAVILIGVVAAAREFVKRAYFGVSVRMLPGYSDCWVVN